MRYHHDISGGFTKTGVSEATFRTAMEKAGAASIDAALAPHAAALIDHAGHDTILTTAQNIRNKFSNLVILGTGGSALCGHALTGIRELEYHYHRKGTRLHFMDNVDPHGFRCLFDTVKPEETFFLVVSKSGGTLETLAQFNLCLQQAQKTINTPLLKYHFLCISDPKTSALRNIAAKFDIPVVEHVAEIGGRFAIFTNVGLLPAAVAGLDIAAVCKGALEVFANRQAPLEGAVLQTLWMKHGMRNSVLMPYLDRLWHFTSWVRQVWAESLGKGGNGSTPIRAAGTLDQHSQMQLYLDGPRDKFFTLFGLSQHESGDPAIRQAHELDYISGKTLGDVLNASWQGTKQTLIKNAIPTRNITIDALDEATLGALSAHFMLETMFSAELLGINAFDQPAVEEGKVLARAALKGA